MRVFDPRFKVFEPGHAKGKYWAHLRRASFRSFLFLATGVLGMVHAIFPFFIPGIMSASCARIADELGLKLCECPPNESI